MKIISVISAHPGSGQTTIVVNLASGLARKGRRVLIADIGNNQKLRRWLNLQLNQVQDSITTVLEGRADLNIEKSNLGMDLVTLGHDYQEYKDFVAQLLALKTSAYDYVLIHPELKEVTEMLPKIPSAVLICTDLKLGNEVEALKNLEQCWRKSGGPADSFTLIVPNKINTKEWEHNTQQLFAIADHFGFAKIADPIPHCERVHDLPLDGRTVWDLSQENLREAFLRLVAAVDNIQN